MHFHALSKLCLYSGRLRVIPELIKAYCAHPPQRLRYLTASAQYHNTSHPDHHKDVMQVPVRPQRKMKYSLTAAGFEIKQIGHNVFQNKSDCWLPTLGPGIYGGQIMALALLSATKTVDSKYVLSSMHCSFLLPAIATTPTIYSVESLRDGRSYCLRAVRVQQSGKTIVVLECTFQLPEPFQLRYEVSCPEVPTPENCQSEVDWYMEALARPNLDLLQRRYYENVLQDITDSSVDARLAKEWRTDDGEFICCRWLKLGDHAFKLLVESQGKHLHKCILSFLSDNHNFNVYPSKSLGLTHSTGPHRLVMRGSLNHSMHFYSDNFDCTDWLLYVMTSPVGGSGRGVSLGRIYTRSGILVALASQEGIMRIDTKLKQKYLDDMADTLARL